MIRHLYILLYASVLMLLITGCKSTGRQGGNDQKGDSIVEPSTELQRDDRPYTWMTDEEYEKYELLKEDKVWQDSLARIISSRLNKDVQMDDLLKLTYTDGEDIYYWNRYWGDLVKVPSGFDVSKQTDWFWKIPNGACFTGIVNGKDSVTVYVSAAHQVVYTDDTEFRESYLNGELKDRPIESIKHSFRRGTIMGNGGTPRSYLFCTYEGKNAKTGKGEFHKTIRALPESDGTFELTVEYPIPKSDGVQKVINLVSSYPNITDVSQYGNELL